VFFQTGFSDQLLAERPMLEGRKADRPLLGGLMALANAALSSGLTQKMVNRESEVALRPSITPGR